MTVQVLHDATGRILCLGKKDTGGGPATAMRPQAGQHVTDVALPTELASLSLGDLYAGYRVEPASATLVPKNAP